MRPTTPSSASWSTRSAPMLSSFCRGSAPFSPRGMTGCCDSSGANKLIPSVQACSARGTQALPNGCCFSSPRVSDGSLVRQLDLSTVFPFRIRDLCLHENQAILASSSGSVQVWDVEKMLAGYSVAAQEGGEAEEKADRAPELSDCLVDAYEASDDARLTCVVADEWRDIPSEAADAPEPGSRRKRRKKATAKKK
mmetsp:Transcript_12534/g.46352  ORF Transcript_12534/g.46352 Transcript_12534/m.46352 type:complete len:195 (+) Transcript_12534:614-1198(+)